MKCENLAKIDVIETKIVNRIADGHGVRKKIPLKSDGKAGMLLKTNVEKMSIFSLSTMLMKTHELIVSLHDVDEKKGLAKKVSER